jgi:excisionase family DNA binding protein
MTDGAGKPHPLTASSTRSTPRFIHLTDVATVLNVSTTQAYALLRSGQLPAIKVGGRGQWRIEVCVLEDFIQRMYAETKTFVEAHPFGTSSIGAVEDSRADVYALGEYPANLRHRPTDDHRGSTSSPW